MNYRAYVAEAVEVFLVNYFRYLVNRDKYTAVGKVTSKRARWKIRDGKME
jgi:hypothetical protein